MSTLTIKTNNHHIPLLSGWELSESQRAELDYIAPVDDQDAWCEQTERFFVYRGQVYDTHEFCRITPRSQYNGAMWSHTVDDDSPLLAWDGIQTDSFFSAIVIRYVDDSSAVQAALVLC